MLALKKYVEENGIKRAAITRMFSAVPFEDALKSRKNAATYDIKYIKKYLEDYCGVQVDLLLCQDRKTKEYDHVHYFRDIEDINQYDVLIFQTYNVNLFTGIWDFDGVDFVDEITYKYKNKILVSYNDPNIQWCNPYQDMMYRGKWSPNGTQEGVQPLNKTEADCEVFRNKPVTALFNGTDWESYWKHSYKKSDCVAPTDVIHIKLSKWISYNILKEEEESKNALFSFDAEDNNDVRERIYDVCYFGGNRKRSREKAINKIFGEDELISKYWIGYDPNFKNTHSTSKIQHKFLKEEVRKSILSLVIGDDAHNNNIITYRFFENVEMGILSLIYDKYDTDKKLIENEELRRYTYFNTAEDILRILEDIKSNPTIYPRLLELQKKELIRVSSDWNTETETKLEFEYIK